MKNAAQFLADMIQAHAHLSDAELAERAAHAGNDVDQERAQAVQAFRKALAEGAFQ